MRPATAGSPLLCNFEAPVVHEARIQAAALTDERSYKRPKLIILSQPQIRRAFLQAVN